MRRSMSNPEFYKAKKKVSDRIDNATIPPNTKNIELYVKLPILTTDSKLTLLTPDDVDSVIPPNNSATDNNPFTFFNAPHSPAKKPCTDDHFDKLIEESLNKNSSNRWFTLLM